VNYNPLLFTKTLALMKIKYWFLLFISPRLRWQTIK